MEPRHGVYVLVNSVTKGVVKIGLTTRHVEDRIKELYGTGVIGRFSCAGFIRTDSDPWYLENQLHNHFAKQNVNGEFYWASPSEVLEVAKTLMAENDIVVEL